jgi:hypothetical protein
MTPEISLLLGAIVGGTGALLSYWAGWRARGRVIRIRGGVIGRPPLIFTEGPVQRGTGSNPTTPKPEIVPTGQGLTKPQPPPGRLIGPGGVPVGYQPRLSRPGANPPPSEP